MPRKKSDKHPHRVSFLVSDALYERGQKLPWSLRSTILRIFYLRVLDIAEKRGSMIYGALLNGHYKIVMVEGEKDESS